MIQKIGPVNLKSKVYDALKKYILSLNIYLKESDFHLDERQLSEKLGVSRTPIREAVAKLEQEGIVKTVPRRGVFVHRKSKKELIDIVTAAAQQGTHYPIQTTSRQPQLESPPPTRLANGPRQAPCPSPSTPTSSGGSPSPAAPPPAQSTPTPPP